MTPDVTRLPEERKLPPHWYYRSDWECALCGKTDTYRERRFTPKPAAWNLRYEWHQTACSSHFL